MDAMGLEQEKEPRYQVTYHTYLASGGRLAYTSSVEHVVGERYAKHSCSANFSITSCSREKRYQALSTFSYCKRWKAGQGLGTRLEQVSFFHAIYAAMINLHTL